MSAPRILPLTELDRSVLDWWRQRAIGEPYRSAYYHPLFAQIAAEVDRPVEVALWQASDGRVLGVLPFMRHGGLLAAPAVPFNDYDGPVTAAGFDPEPRALLRAARAEALQFWHLHPLDRPRWAPFVMRRRLSPRLDVRGGLDAYRERLGASSRSELSATLRKGRKMGRELGPLRFVFDDPSPGLMQQLVTLKRAQYRATGAPDAFAEPWRLALLEQLRQTGDDACRGRLSALYAGDRVVALHYYLQCHGVLHSWFPVYDETYARYSPGRVLLAMTVEQAPSLDIECIDLGKGEMSYKLRAMTHAVEVGEGLVGRSLLAARWRRMRAQAIDRIRASRPYDWARQLKRRLTRRGR